jgi:hypothetical protein
LLFHSLDGRSESEIPILRISCGWEPVDLPQPIRCRSNKETSPLFILWTFVVRLLFLQPFLDKHFGFVQHKHKNSALPRLCLAIDSVTQSTQCRSIFQVHTTAPEKKGTSKCLVCCPKCS